jgi:hypothetical protein
MYGLVLKTDRNIIEPYCPRVIMADYKGDVQRNAERLEESKAVDVDSPEVRAASRASAEAAKARVKAVEAPVASNDAVEAERAVEPKPKAKPKFRKRSRYRTAV